MSRTPWICSTLLTVAAFGCGGGTDGQPVPPPTAPSVPTVPPPVPTVQALVWLHSAPENAGGYYVGDRIVLIADFEERVSVVDSPRLAIKVGEQIRDAIFSPWVEDDFPPEQLSWLQRFEYRVAPEDEDHDGISVAADGFDFSHGALLNASGAEIEVEIFAVATTRNAPVPAAPGEALGAHRVIGTPPPRVCTNEREMVLRYEGGNHIAREWNPERPFRFFFDEAALRQCGESLGLPDWYETEIVGRIASAQADFEARLGYAIFEAIPAAEGPGVITITTRSRSNDPETECERGSSAYARPTEGLLYFSFGYCDLACRPPREVGWQAEPTVRTGTVIHELGHILGMRHHDRGEPDDTDSQRMYGLEMSEKLDGVFYQPRTFTVYDIDRLGCAYPLEEAP